MQSQKLKKAVAKGKVVVINPHSGESKVFLYDSLSKKKFSVDIPPCSEVELAPRFCSPADVLLSQNLGELLLHGHLRIKA